MKTIIMLAIIAFFLAASGLSAFAQGTAFTYQGRLNSGGSPASGSYDFRFKLYADPLGNTQVGAGYFTNAIPATNGLFITTIDFGAGIFTGSNYWLEVDVKTNNADSYTVLSPLQAVTPTPYAIMANTASNLLGALPAAQISGPVASANLCGTYSSAMVLNNSGNSFSGTFTGNVIGPASSATNFTGSLSGDVTGKQGATAVSTVGGQTAASVAGGVAAANAATNISTPNTIVKRDATGSFAATNFTLAGSLYLPVPTNGVGMIYAGGSPYVFSLYPANTYSFFAGPGAGNLAMSGSQNTGIGYEALYKNTSGFNNTGIGYMALANNTSGYENTAVGYNALEQNFSGSWNIALGMNAGMNITTGSSNIDIGNNVGQSSDNNIIRIGSGQTQTYIAGVIYGNGAGLTNIGNGASLTNLNLTGPSAISALGNSAEGYQALYINTSGSDNAANGAYALNLNTNGSYNTANGYQALAANRSGNNNTAVGNVALNYNISGSDNTAVGSAALMGNTIGSYNTALGFVAGGSITTGNNNTLLGYEAGINLTTNNNNIALGYLAGGNLYKGCYNIDIGNPGALGDNGIIRIGTMGTHTASYLTGDIYWGNGGMARVDQGGSLELGDSTSNGATPYIDFHYGTGNAQDFNVRIQNDANEELCITRASSTTPMAIFNASGVTVNGNATVNGTNTVYVLTITGGSDVAEPFDLSTRDIPNGAVVVIDEQNPGRLKMSDRPCDTRVAGIVSGANGIKPGITLHQAGALDGGQNVALSGRVYALADASNGAIQPGDLLTTSGNPGHCMKVTDHAKAQGAILGKAMTRLERGQGMVLVLVSLQ